MHSSRVLLSRALLAQPRKCVFELSRIIVPRRTFSDDRGGISVASRAGFFNEDESEIKPQVVESRLNEVPLIERNVTRHVFKDVDRWRDRVAIK